jgi:hypothetical protein
MADVPQGSDVPSRAWYVASIAEFLHADFDSVLGRLARSSDFTVLPTQRDAWLAQIQLLHNHLGGLIGSLFMEFSIARTGRRIDTVLLIGPIVFAVEFKVGDTFFDRAGVDQVWDYALDLKNFHEASLAVSMRSFRAENVSAFVKALLQCQTRVPTPCRALSCRRLP